MNRTTTNQATQTPPEDRKWHGHYFTLARAKFRGAVDVCERMGMEYYKEIVFRTFKVSHRKAMSFYVMTRLRADDTMIPIKKKLVDAANLLVQRNYVKWGLSCKKKALKHVL